MVASVAGLVLPSSGSGLVDRFRSQTHLIGFAGVERRLRLVPTPWRARFQRVAPHRLALGLGNDPAMGFNRRKMEAERKAKADAEVAARRAANSQVFVDAERLIAAWNGRQARRMPVLFYTDDRRRAHGSAPLPVGLLPRLPHHARHCCARSTATLTPPSPA